MVDPEVVPRWADRAGVAGADIRAKNGTHHNELTRHRDQVVLHKPGTAPADAPRRLDVVPTLTWEGDLGRLADRLRDRSEPAVRITGIPNARLTEEAAAARALGSTTPRRPNCPRSTPPRSAPGPPGTAGTRCRPGRPTRSTCST